MYTHIVSLILIINGPQGFGLNIINIININGYLENYPVLIIQSKELPKYDPPNTIEVGYGYPTMEVFYCAHP